MRRPIRNLILGSALAWSCCARGAAALPASAQQSDREMAGLAEEQALLSRQLQRLRLTMENLAPRLEKEGRSHALELLKQGLALLDQRLDEGGARTLVELMDAAREGVESGRAVQSLERQEAIITGLERLIAILTDRESLERLESSLDQLRQMRARIGDLKNQEAALQRDTQALREDAAGEAQRALEEELARLTEAQRELLRQNERQGRADGSLEREELERELAQLLVAQRVDRGVLESWQPKARAELESAFTPLDEARRESARAERLTAAAQSLREAAQEARAAASADDVQPQIARLEAEAEREDRQARASKDSAAEAARDALSASARELRDESAQASGRARAAQNMEQRAAQLDAAAAEADRKAGAAREAAAQQLAEMERALQGSAAAQAAAQARRSLEEDAGAPPAAEGAPAPTAGNKDSAEAAARTDARRARERARVATDRAANGLRTALEDERRVGALTSASQAKGAQDAERLARGVEALPKGESSNDESDEAGTRASQALAEAARAMREASAAARAENADQAGASARSAEGALERALEALGQARQQASQAAGATPQGSAGPSSELAGAQEELARRSQQASEQSSEGALSESSRAAVQEALDAARDAQRQAAEQLGEGRSASAAGSQREAVQALERASEAAKGGVGPRTEAQRERAAEQARRQEEIRRQLLELARLNEERRNATPNKGLQRASQKAGEASQSLSDGELDDAESQEEDVQRELENADRELSQEEEQYQRLRQEELLFRIAEETKSLLDAHAAALESVKEIDAERAGAERPSRAQRLRLRRVATDESGLAARSDEIAKAIEEESSLVFAHVFRENQRDLTRIAELLDETGEWETGDRVQTLQEDVAESFRWVLEALKAEQKRRQDEDRQAAQQGQQGGQNTGKNRLVPDVAELKLLRRMEVETLERLDRLQALHPELAAGDGEVDPDVLEEVLRLAERHERTTKLFGAFRERLGLPDPDAPGVDVQPPPIRVEDGDKDG